MTARRTSDYLGAAHSWAVLFSCTILLPRNVFFFRDRCYKHSSFLNYFLYSLQVRNPQTGMCLDTMAKFVGSELGVSPCHNMGGNQVLLKIR